MNWQVLLKLNRALPTSSYNLAHYSRKAGSSLGDPLFESWVIAWDGHALTHQPLHFFDANTFWPLRNSLAFSDALLGYVPAGIIGSGPTAAVVRYNLLYLFAYALAFAGATLLARELDVGWGAAAVCGAAFAFTGWRLAQTAHLHVLSSGGIPMSLWLLLRGWRARRAGLVLAGWVVAAWQVSLGFTLGVPFAYLLAALALSQVVRWWLRRRPPVARRMVIASISGIAIFGAWTAIQALPYLKVLHDFPDAKRSEQEATRFSPPAIGYLAAPNSSLVWGRVTKPVRDRMSAYEEKTLFPGAAAGLLALSGIVASTRPRIVRLGLLAAAVIFGVLSLGFGTFHGWLGYRFVWLYFPGWNSSRTPGRLVTFVLLSLALLAAIGAHDLIESVGLRSSHRSHRLMRFLLPGLLIGLVLAEGVGRLDYPTIPSGRAGLEGLSPRLDLPTDAGFDTLYELWSTDGFPQLVNGQSTFVPCFLRRLREIMTTFPDQRSIQSLRSIAVNAVVLHVDLVAGSEWAGVADRPIDGLGISRAVVGNLIVYRLGNRRPIRPAVPHDRCPP
jgi:hypothetical protein